MKDLYNYVSAAAHAHGIFDDATIEDIFQEVRLELHLDPTARKSTVTSRLVAAALRQARKFASGGGMRHLEWLSGLIAQQGLASDKGTIGYDAAISALLDTASAKLKPKEYEILYRVLAEGDSFAAAGEKLGKSGDAIRLALIRIGKKLNK